MEPIRILHIVTAMGHGGLEAMLMNYYRNIDRTQVQFDFLVHRDYHADFDDEIESMGGKIYRISPLNPFSPSYYKELKRFFLTHNYNTVHCHLDCTSAIPLYVAKCVNIKNRIAHAHSANQDKNLKYPLKLILKRFIKYVATQMFACGKKAGEWTFKTDNFLLFNNAIDTTKFSNNIISDDVLILQEKLKNSFVIGHVGRFIYPKNHSFLIDIFYNVLKHDKNAKLILVGTGYLIDEIQKKVEALNIQDNVIFTGAINNVHEIIQLFDIFVFPSIYEGFPVTSIEAQTVGLPCILSDKITVDCKITDNVEFLSLELEPEHWAQVILKYKGYNKSNQSELIKLAGFDVKSNAIWLQKYYKELENEQ